MFDIDVVKQSYSSLAEIAKVLLEPKTDKAADKGEQEEGDGGDKKEEEKVVGPEATHTHSVDVTEDEGEEAKHYDPEKQQQIEDLNAKLADLQAELDLPQSEFEERLMKRLRDEIKTNRAQLEVDLKAELAVEKKRLLAAANEEKNSLKSENQKLMSEIQKLKVLLRGTGRF